ncbi:MAG: SRPBCC family protein [Gammaproteobacteria bacterium]|nr:SRPBCC family protein [Gammaproteobacteria bacterium]MDH5801131.1 SRPBCC family protein [Gammaproteobacteria bacterium]
MKILLKLFVSLLVAMVLAVLIIAAVVPGEYELERNIVVNRDITYVFNYIKHLKNQSNYSVWAKLDPDMKKAYRGEDGRKGFVYAWDSTKRHVGKGEQEIVRIEEGVSIETEVRFYKPFDSVNVSYMGTEKQAGGNTRVTWVFRGKMPYPFSIFLLFMNMDQEVGEDLQQGLVNLKTVLEARS